MPTESSPSAANFDEVCEKELAEIVTRRKCQGLDDESVRKNLVGLALSGGGVRSASFNLGVLQAFLRRGLLKYVDYLSTVSGGGYIGSFLASLPLKLREKKLGKEMARHATKLTTLSTKESRDPQLEVERRLHEQNLAALRGQPLKAQEVNEELERQLLPTCGGQPRRVVEMVRDGKYLNRPESFANFYIIGLILNNLAIFSGLATLCMAIAYGWRWLDDNWLGGWIYLRLWPSRFWIELWRPFLPAVVLFGLWVGVWLCAFTYGIWKRQRPRTGWTQRLLIFASITLLIGVAVVLATPVISIPDVGSDQISSDQVPEEGVKEISGRQHVIATTIFGLILTALTPFLKFDWLLQSGIHPKRLWERQVFLVASSALLVGVPLILIWWFAHHDFAGLDKKTRDRQILMGDINYRRWPTFWERVKRERDAKGSPGSLVYEAVDRSAPDDLKELGLPRDMKMSRSAIDLGELPVPLEQAARDQKQRIIDAINASVIGVHKDAVTEKVIGVPECQSDFANEVCDFWWQTQKGVSKPLNRREVVAAKVHHHGEAHRILDLLDRRDQSQITSEEKKEFNRLILEASYPEEIIPRLKIFRQNVIEADQKCRLFWLSIFGAVFLVSGCINLNATSLHSFYRNRLAATFIERDEKDSRTVRLSDLDTTSHGAPYFLMAGTLNRKPRDRDPSMLDHESTTPTEARPSNSTPARRQGPEQPGETPTEVFLMSRLFCGSESLGYRPSSDYHDGRLELDDAMAISGAAFSPVQTSNPMIGFLMTIFNMRLGQWLPTPKRDRPRWPRLQRWLPFSKPCFLVLLWDWLRDWVPSQRPYWYFVTDGGHHENLGVWSLLERRCQLIIVSDASEDGGAGFADLLRVLRRARFEKGIDVVSFSEKYQKEKGKEGVASLLGLLRFTPLEDDARSAKTDKQSAKDSDRHPSRVSRRHFFIARIKYPGDDERKFNYLVYLKPSLTGDEPAELQGYASLNADFPHHPTLDQLYDEDKFESYRQLGEHIGNRLVAKLHLPHSAMRFDINALIEDLINEARHEQQVDGGTETSGQDAEQSPNLPSQLEVW